MATNPPDLFYQFRFECIVGIHAEKMASNKNGVKTQDVNKCVVKLQFKHNNNICDVFNETS